MTVAAGTVPKQTKLFAPHHRWDHNFFLAYVVLIWLGIVMGFGGDIIHHLKSNEASYPLIVHIHAVAFVGWMFVLTAQVLLIRVRRPDVHRKLGMAAMGLAAIMVVLGPATAIEVERVNFGTPKFNPAFFAIQFTDILAFAGFVGAAFALRGSASHKRLMLMATIYISDAGFGRWLGSSLHGAFGSGFWGHLLGGYFANIVLFLGIGAYDLITRRRLLPAYSIGLVWALANMVVGHILYHSPWWKLIAIKITGH